MKKKLFFTISVLLLLLISFSATQAQSMFGLSAGYLRPKDTKNGLMFGVNLGSAVDEAVTIGLGADFFQKSYSKMSKVAEEKGPITETTTKEMLVDYSRIIVPLNLSVRVKIPASRMYDFGYFIRGSVNYHFLWSNEKNYQDNTDETRKFGGMGWQGGGGLYYKVGSRSTLFAEAFFNSCEVKRDVSTSTKSLPVSEFVDLSGVGFRIGVQLDME